MKIEIERNVKKLPAHNAGVTTGESDIGTAGAAAELAVPNVPRSERERLARGLAAADDALLAAAEAEARRRKVAGERVDPSCFRDDGPDPLGTDWAWTGEPPEPK